MLTASPTETEVKYAEALALRDLARRFPTLGIQLEAALSAAYRRALADAGVIPPDSPLLFINARVLP